MFSSTFLIGRRKKKNKRSKKSRIGDVICLVMVVLLFICFLLLFSSSNLPPNPNQLISSTSTATATEMGEVGEMMVDMLPQDLPFTLFLPSQQAFKDVLRLTKPPSPRNDTSHPTYALLSRVMAFSAVPRPLLSTDVLQNEICLDSVSGYTLCIWKKNKNNNNYTKDDNMSSSSSSVLVVNGVESTGRLDLRRGELVVHVMDGVLMDPDLRHSFPGNQQDR